MKRPDSRAINKRAQRYAKRQAKRGNLAAYTAHAIAVAAYEVGYKSGNGVAIKAPAAALLHVLDTQRELKAKIVQLRAALRALGDTAMREASL